MGYPWGRRVLIGGQEWIEEQYLHHRYVENSGGVSLSALAEEIANILPPLHDGSRRTSESVRGKLRRMQELEERELPEDSPEIDVEIPLHARPLVEDLNQPEVDLDTWLDTFDRLQALINKADPIVTHATINLDVDCPVAIQFVSDVHLGSRYTAHEKVRQSLNYLMQKDNLYWGLHGDDIDGFLSNFRSAKAVFDQLVPPPRQRQILVEIIKRLARHGKLLYATKGEHGGLWYENVIGENPIKSAYLENKIPFFDGKGILRLTVGDIEYRLGIAHNLKGRSLYNPNHPQKRALLNDFPQVDVVVSGHYHTYAVQKQTMYVQEADAGLRADPYVWLIQCGTAKIGNDPYSIWGWNRGIWEWPCLVFSNRKHKIRLVENLEDLDYFLR